MYSLNELMPGIINAALGFVGVIISSAVSFYAGKKVERASRERLILELGFEEHKYRTDLAIKIANQNGSSAEIYPSFFAIKYIRSVLEIIFSSSDDKDILKRLEEAKINDENFKKAYKESKS